KFAFRHASARHILCRRHSTAKRRDPGNPSNDFRSVTTDFHGYPGGPGGRDALLSVSSGEIRGHTRCRGWSSAGANILSDRYEKTSRLPGAKVGFDGQSAAPASGRGRAVCGTQGGGCL